MCTHGPAQHDLRVADGVRGGDVRADHRAVCDARTGLWHLVRLGGDAVRTLAVHVYGCHAKLIGGTCKRETMIEALSQCRGAEA